MSKRRSMIVRADEVTVGDDAAVAGYGGTVHNITPLTGGRLRISIVTEWGHAAADTFRITDRVHITR